MVVSKIFLSRLHSCKQKNLYIYSYNRTLQVVGSTNQSERRSSVLSDGPSCYNVPRRWHVGHSHHHEGRSSAEGENIFRIGLAADIFLAAGKAFTGYVTGSTAIIADAAHSISDVVLSGAALVSFKAGRVPKDKEHPYGHGKFETLGALGISCMLVATAGGIGWHAIDLLLGLLSAAPDVASHSLGHEHGHSHHHGGHHHGIDMSHPILALNMVIISITVKEGLYWMTKRAGERQGSRLMQANAWHHRADAVSSLVALIGVGGSILGVKFLDPLAGVAVSGMILKAGLQSGYYSILELVDAAVPSEQLDPYKHTILQIAGVKGCNHLRGRRAGSFLYLDVNIEVDPFSSVSAAHEVGENVRHEIHKLHPEIAEVFIHIDPAISLLPSTSSIDQQECTEDRGFKNRNLSSELKDIEDTISNILSSKFSEKMVLEHVTRHFLPDKILLQLDVSMPPHLLISDAKELAEEAEREIVQAVPHTVEVCIQLRLGRAMPQLQESNKGTSF